MQYNNALNIYFALISRGTRGMIMVINSRKLSQNGTKKTYKDYIKLGNSSFAIALPKDWVDKSKLKKGDNVFIVPNSNGEIVISSEFKKVNGEKKTIIITKLKDKTTLYKEITSAYIRGYTHIEFDIKDNISVINNLKEILEDLMGMEIVEKTSEKMIAKDFFNMEDANVENFIRRMDNNIKEMFDINISCLNNNKISKQEILELKTIDEDINKLYLVISRLFLKAEDNPSLVNALKTTNTNLFHHWWLCFNLESLGDSLKSIAKRMQSEDLKDKKFDRLKKLIVEIKRIYNLALESFFKKDKNAAHILAQEGKKIWEECDEIAQSKDGAVGIIGDNLKTIETISYQIAKMVTYLID